MSRTRSRIIAVVSLGLAACCPTLWLQINKGNPAPWPAVGSANIAHVPVLPPPSVQNRFDVLEGGKPTVWREAATYTDVFDDGEMKSDLQQHALDALAWIENKSNT